MSNGTSQFIGTAGQYYVAYGLEARQIHAALTIGNALGVDVLAAKDDGSRMLSIQVKTARNATKRSYGDDGYNWDVGKSAVGKFSESLWYAFVDMEGTGFKPSVYFVPSRWVGLFVEPAFTRKLFFLRKSVADKVRNNWDFVNRYLDGDVEMATWANSLDPDFRWWGSKDGCSSAEIEECIKNGVRWNANGSPKDN